MDSELQNTLARLISKSRVLVEKYNALKAAKEAVEQENAELKAMLAKLVQDIDKCISQLME